MDSLSVGSLLQSGKYKIIKALGQGGFGITYLAEQVALGREVAIKEFFMRDYCDRDNGASHVSVPTENSRDIVNNYKQKFVKEAQTIASLRHSHIVSIHDIFEENGTAYYVMEYLNNGSLIDIIKQRGPLPEEDAIQYIIQVGGALSYIHDRNILHLDVKPSNILLNDDGNAVLIDFGISKRYDESGGQTSTTPVGISKGYAPIEQYQQGSITKFSPSTDVYSLGATLYFLLSGETPPEATEVYENGLPDLGQSVSSSTRDAISLAMKPNRKERLQSIQSFVSLLRTQIASTNNDTDFRDESNVSVADNPVEQDEETVVPSVAKVSFTETNTKGADDSEVEPGKGTKKRSSALIWTILAVILVGGICGIFVLRHSVDDEISIAGVTEYSVSFGDTDNTTRSLAFRKNFTEAVAFYGIPDWCKVYYSDKELLIDCLSNGSEKERKAVIQLRRDGKSDILATLFIVQAGKNKATNKTRRTNTVTASSEQSQEKKASLIHLQESRIDLRIGESHTIKYSISPAEASSRKVAWSSSNTEIATINSKGVVIARKVGSTYITATVDGVSSSCIVSVEKKNESESTAKNNSHNHPSGQSTSSTASTRMHLSHTSLTLNVGETIKLTAYNYGSSIRWTVDDGTVATIQQDGTIRAVAPGVTHVRVYGKETLGCLVIVQAAKTTSSSAGVPILNEPNEPMYLARSEVSLFVGQSMHLYAFNYGSSLKWESDDPSKVSVSSDGEITALSRGTVKIWAIGKKRLSCKVTVKKR